MFLLLKNGKSKTIYGSLEYFLASVFFGAFLFSGPSFARKSSGYDGKPAPKVASEKIKELVGVGIDEKISKQLDLSIGFVDENGKSVKLGDFFQQGLPVMMSPVYYGCASLCNFHLSGIFEAFQGMDWGPGDKFVYLAISFDSIEKPELAFEKRDAYLKKYAKPNWKPENIHFLTATKDSIEKWTQSIGFKASWDEESKQWAHGSTAVIASHSGQIMRYLPGIAFEPKDLKFAINESANGRLGGFVDALMLYCFKYNPHQSKYTLAAFNLVKIGGLFMIIFLAIWLIPFWRKNFRREQTSTRSS